MNQTHEDDAVIMQHNYHNNWNKWSGNDS